MNLEIKTNGLLDWCLFLFTSQVWQLERTPFSLVADMRKKITFTTSCGKRCKQKVIFITSIQPFLETKNAQAVWDALIHQDAHFYVSGCISYLLCPKWVILNISSARQMPKDVEALKTIFKLNKKAEEANAFLQQLQREKRFLEDTWQ